MSDIIRSYSEIELKDAELRTSLIKIRLSEKKNQIAQLNVTLDRMKTVEIKKIEHQIKVLEKEIEYLDQELTARNNAVIDAEISKEGE